MLKFFCSLVTVLAFFLTFSPVFAAEQEPAAAQTAAEAQPDTATAPEAAAHDGSLQDRELLDRLQRDAFRYMWEHTFPESGLAYEDSRNSKSGQATTGGTGFGVAAIVVAVERGWIERDAAVERLLTMTGFLKDRTERQSLHGAFPHWLDGRTGKTIAFGENDNGADIVETAFLMQGLLIARAYFDADLETEQQLRRDITELWEGVDWHWFTKAENNGLFWHWSPDHGFDMGMKISGFNEAMVAYVLALGSPTHPISREAAKFWYSTEEYTPKTGNGYTIEAANKYAGCMFLSHYSFIGLDPRRMADAHVRRGYMVRNTTHALMNRAYCLESAPAEHQFSEGFWGLTSCDIKGGYRYQSAYNEVGTVAPTAALASMPYTPEYSMRVLWNLWENYREQMWGKYGPYDAFSLKDGWFDDSYLAIDQLPIVCMVENYRSGLLWTLFMNIPEVQQGLDRMEVRELPPADGFSQIVLPLRRTDSGYETDALDLRRHPDSGLYTVPYGSSEQRVIFFSVTDAEGRVVKRFTREARTGENVLAFEPFAPASDEVFTLHMRSGGVSDSLPLRFH
ncbi:glucoamylase family protein [uncultured Mailhella sp.]|uniref:glucoamylase family protein n=1 Tax=uncultured Mailhella sp. TaxID=1981031 RepID=UPI002627610D|nr:glucoamylase family protein [uncultured Mailhella sp.]